MHTDIRRIAGRALVALALVLATSTHALAQGMYYKEIRKDERIYVFNNAEEAERFEKSGEMGRALTRPGAGPNGETVVGDSERALQLFFFKYGISEVVAEPKPPTQRIEWRDGKTRITTDNAYLEMSNRVQVRYTHDFPDDSVQLPGTDAPGDSRGSFRIRRAKFKLEGWFWKQNNLTYEVQMNWPAATGSNIGAFLEDANIAWDPAGKGEFRILFGQFKVPFGHQELTSSGNQSFVDRSIVSNEYARGRDTGVAVQGVLFNKKIEYRAGMFNGNGLTRTINDNGSFQYNARVMWQPNGSQNLVQRAWVGGALYSEGDFESTTTPIYAIGLNFEHNDFHGTTTGADLKSTIFGLDGVFKFKGFFATGEYYWREREPETGDEFNSDAWFVQASQMLNARRTIEAAFRYATREVSERLGNDGISELRGGVSYYYRRHSLKIQADVGRIETELGPGSGERGDTEFRLQTQFIF
jgi:phosphate-selective porin OprO/OprP